MRKHPQAYSENTAARTFLATLAGQLGCVKSQQACLASVDALLANPATTTARSNDGDTDGDGSELPRQQQQQQEALSHRGDARHGSGAGASHEQWGAAVRYGDSGGAARHVHDATERGVRVVNTLLDVLACDSPEGAESRKLPRTPRDGADRIHADVCATCVQMLRSCRK
jgi:hypothetical protein